MTGKDLLEALAAGLTAAISNAMERLFGPGVRRPAVGSVTWADPGTVLGLWLLVLLFNGLADAVRGGPPLTGGAASGHPEGISA